MLPRAIHRPAAARAVGRSAAPPFQGAPSGSRWVSFLVYGANTDVGKTLASAALCRSAALRGGSGAGSVTYIKPVQTGADADASAVARHCGAVASSAPLAVQTLFHYSSPESPHTAARKDGGGVSDTKLRAAVTAALARASASSFRLVETAGGPLSPAPSGTPQADVYAALRLPCVLVGDARLGGISATLCAAEALEARGQPASAVVFIGGCGDDGNAAGLRVVLAALKRPPVHVVSVPAAPPMPEPLDKWLQDEAVVAGFDSVLAAVETSSSGRMSAAEYAAVDREHLWHPYTSMAQPGRIWPVRSAEGCEIELEDGRRLIDGMSSWWCAVHGYNVPELNAAASRQLSSMSHVMFGGLTHRPAAELAQLLLGCLPKGLNRIFLCDSGSVSVEVALKMATQYWAMRGRPEKCRIVSVRRGYHGDTFGAMAACDPDNGMHGMFKGILPSFLFADAPERAPDACMRDCSCAPGVCEGAGDDGFASMEALLEGRAGEVSAVIVEPIVQGAGGMRIYPPSYLARLRALCDRLEVLLIFDEIATGFGRTGRLFASEHAGVTPDIMCIGKALTGGYCTLAATVATEAVALGVSGGGGQPLMHGPTYMGNPLACAIAVASLRLLLAGPWRERVSSIEAQMQRELEGLLGNKAVADVRVLGAIGVVELKAAPKDPGALQAKLVDLGVWIRPFGTLIYIMPPYVITKRQLSQLTSAIAEVVSAGIELVEET